MDRMLLPRTLAVLCVLGLAPVAQAQGPGGGPMPVQLRVVDQNGTELTGSKVSLVGTDQSWETPATANLDFGPALFTIEPAFQGTMFANGWMRPAAPNGLTRDEFLFVDGSPELVIVWNTSQVAMNVVDPSAAPISGASWGFEGDGNWFGPGTVTAPVTDEAVYPSMSGASRDGWKFAVRAAFDGQAIDLTRTEAREVDGSTSSLSFEWRQSACNMGVVDGTGAPIRGATWTMFGHTFAAGDAITLPATDDASAGGSLADGIPTSVFTNTSSGSGNATFEVNADGSLSPSFVTIGGGSFGLRCGVAPFPPVGTLDGTVLADGAARPGVDVTLRDANNSTRTLTTDAAGRFAFTEVLQGAATVTIAVPSGFHALVPQTGQLTTTVTAGATTTVQFTIERDVPPVTTGTLDGTVLADGKPRPGVEVTLQDANNLARTLTSDAVGGFVFTEVPQGTATVTIKIPSGYHALDPKTGQLTTTVTAGAMTTVQFEIESDVPPPVVVNVPENANYWRKEIRAALRGRGNHNETFANMSVGYPQAIFDGFANNVDAVRVEGVTQVDPDGAGPQPARRLTLAEMDATIDPSLSTQNTAAKQELLVILLNVVSNRLSLNLVVDAQGTTLAQQIRVLAAMINDGMAANDRKAHEVAQRINEGHATDSRLHPCLNDMVATVADASIPDVASGLSVQREGGRNVRFTIAMSSAGNVTLDLYDVAGRHVERLYEGTASAGETGITWSGGRVRAGLYFARMIGPDGAHGVKVILQ